jgi:hypothetical protein
MLNLLKGVFSTAALLISVDFKITMIARKVISCYRHS